MTYCKSKGGNLASIVDENEQNYIFSQLPGLYMNTIALSVYNFCENRKEFPKYASVLNTQ